MKFICKRVGCSEYDSKLENHCKRDAVGIIDRDGHVQDVCNEALV